MISDLLLLPNTSVVCLACELATHCFRCLWPTVVSAYSLLFDMGIFADVFCELPIMSIIVHNITQRDSNKYKGSTPNRASLLASRFLFLYWSPNFYSFFKISECVAQIHFLYTMPCASPLLSRKLKE